MKVKIINVNFQVIAATNASVVDGDGWYELSVN